MTDAIQTAITYDIDDSHGATSGTQTALYLIPAAESGSGAIEVCLFRNVGPGTPEPAWHGRWFYIGNPGTEYVAESLIEYLQGHEDDLRRINAAYLGSEWDGSNHRGRWEESIGDEAPWFDTQDVASYWDAFQWMEDADADDLASNGTMAAAVEEAISYARTENAYLEADQTERAIRQKIESAIERAERELELADDDDREEYAGKLAKLNAFLATGN